MFSFSDINTKWLNSNFNFLYNQHKEGSNTKLKIISSGEQGTGHCIAIKGITGKYIFDAGQGTLSDLPNAIDLLDIRCICVASFEKARFGDLDRLVDAYRNKYIPGRVERILRLMGPIGIKEASKHGMGRDYPFRIMIANGRRWFWNIESFLIEPGVLGYILYRDGREKVVYLPQLALTNIDPHVHLSRADLLVVGIDENVPGQADNFASLKNTLWSFAAKKVILVPSVDVLPDGIERICNPVNGVKIGKKGMTVSVG